GKPVPFPCVEPRASERVPAVPSPVCARLRQQSRSRAGRSAEAAGDQLSSSFLLSFGRVYPWYPKRPGRRCLPFVPAAVPRARSGPDAAPSEFLQISWGLLRLDLPQRHRPAGRSSPAGCRRRCPPVLRVSSCFADAGRGAFRCQRDRFLPSALLGFLLYHGQQDGGRYMPAKALNRRFFLLQAIMMLIDCITVAYISPILVSFG
ncbi:Peroxidase-related enzyme, partial [Dysosmobacter welbionis]